jgi:PREDICTED: hypothetical protein
MSCVVVSACGFPNKEETEQSSEKKSKKKNKKKKDKKKKDDIEESDIDEDEEESTEKEIKSTEKASSDYSELKQQISDEINDFLVQDKVALNITYGRGADSWSADVIRERHEGVDYYYFHPIGNPDDNTRILVLEDDIYISTDYSASWTKVEEENDYGYTAVSSYLKYINYLSFVYAAIESGVEVKLNDGGVDKHVITINEKEADNLDTDPVRLGIISDTSKLREIEMYRENQRVLKVFNKDSTKVYVFGPSGTVFSMMESIRDENGMETEYTIVSRVPNERIDEIEMMPLDGLLHSIQSSN